jgi:hypothetical protein
MFVSQKKKFFEAVAALCGLLESSLWRFILQALPSFYLLLSPNLTNKL